MKKSIAGFMLATAILIPSLALAKPGDIAGKYYWTDINAVLNGHVIDSINIGGETLISAEDMMYYSFNVSWLPEHRMLDINETEHATNGAPPSFKTSNYSEYITPGTIRGNYYETDIITRLDGRQITSYNIGGATYIHAEQMAEHGYVVEWNSIDRNLFITSPRRAGYIWDIPMSYGQEKKSEGTGAFSLTYSDGKVTATDDADYFSSTLRITPTGEYYLNMGFYQTLGLFYSTELQNTLKSLASRGYGIESSDPKEKYDLINEKIKFSINGIEAKKIEIYTSGGNGHRDYIIAAMDLPRYKESEITEIKISVGNSGGEPYEITPPDYAKDELAKITESLKKYKYDFMQSRYQTDTHALIYMCESEHFGIIKHRLYVIDKETASVSGDILNQVRELEGFNADKLNPFAFKTDDAYKNRIYFSCSTDEKTGDFYVETDTHRVYKIAESKK